MNKTLSTWLRCYFSHPEAIILLVILVGAIIIFKTMGQVLAPIIIAITLAYLLFGIVKKLKYLRFPHLLAVSVVFILFVSLLLLLFLWLLPLLWEEMAGLVAEFPGALNCGQGWLLKLRNRFPEFISTAQLDQVVSYMTAYVATFGKEVVTFSLTSIVSIAALVVYLILVPLLVFFFLRDGDYITQWFIQFLPERRSVLQKIWHELCKKVGSYIHGRVIEVLFITFVTIMAFWFLGLRYAMLLGALVGLSVVIPYVGMVLVTIPIVVVGLIQWGLSWPFLYLMLFYVAISIFDANILVPILFAEVMDLHPLSIILAVLIFGSLFGFWGIFFAIPLMALANIILKFWPKEN